MMQLEPIDEWEAKEENGWPQWSNASDLRDLGKLVVDWLEGRSLVMPSQPNPPDKETELIKPSLIQLNENGFVTFNAQPRTLGEKAWVSGISSKIAAVEISCAVYSAGLHCEMAKLDEPNKESNLLAPPWEMRIPPANRERFLPENITLSENLEKELMKSVGMIIWDTRTRKNCLWETLLEALENTSHLTSSEI